MHVQCNHQGGQTVGSQLLPEFNSSNLYKYVFKVLYVPDNHSFNSQTPDNLECAEAQDIKVMCKAVEQHWLHCSSTLQTQRPGLAISVGFHKMLLNSGLCLTPMYDYLLATISNCQFNDL